MTLVQKYRDGGRSCGFSYESKYGGRQVWYTLSTWKFEIFRFWDFSDFDIFFSWKPWNITNIHELVGFTRKYFKNIEDSKLYAHKIREELFENKYNEIITSYNTNPKALLESRIMLTWWSVDYYFGICKPCTIRANILRIFYLLLI